MEYYVRAIIMFIMVSYILYFLRDLVINKPSKFYVVTFSSV